MKFIFFLLFLFSYGIAKTIPNFALVDIDGKNFVLYKELGDISLNEFLVMNFMSTTCEPCKKEIPELLQIARENPHIKLVFVFMGDKDEDALWFVKKFQMQEAYRILYDRLEISFLRLGFKGIPTTLIIKKDKTIYKMLSGYNQKNILELRKLGL